MKWQPDDILDAEHGSRPRLLAEQCETCVGRPGNPAQIRPGRLQELIRFNTGPGRMGLVCHSTLYTDETQPALCRWFYDHFGHLAGGIRIMERIGGRSPEGPFCQVPPPDKDKGNDAEQSRDAAGGRDRAAGPEPLRRAGQTAAG